MNLKISQRFPGKRAFITGAGSGLGRSFCQWLARDGWHIFVSDIQPGPLEQTCREINSLGGKAYSCQLDVSDEQAYLQAARQCLDTLGGLDLLINNAGIGDGDLLSDYTTSLWKRMIEINLYGVLHGFKSFVPVFQKQKSGQIISIASAAGFVNPPGMSAYNASKAAVISLSETMYYELAIYQVGVTVLLPTFFKTNIMQFSQGSERVRAFATRQMENSTTTAPELARVCLEGAANRRLYVLHPQKARTRWVLKRHFPRILRKKILRNLSTLLNLPD